MPWAFVYVSHMFIIMTFVRWVRKYHEKQRRWDAVWVLPCPWCGHEVRTRRARCSIDAPLFAGRPAVNVCMHQRITINVGTRERVSGRLPLVIVTPQFNVTAMRGCDSASSIRSPQSPAICLRRAGWRGNGCPSGGACSCLGHCFSWLLRELDSRCDLGHKTWISRLISDQQMATRKCPQEEGEERNLILRVSVFGQSSRSPTDIAVGGV
jgi:hypothetical protein